MITVPINWRDELDFVEEMKARGYELTARSAPLNAGGEVVYFGVNVTGRKLMAVDYESYAEVYFAEDVDFDDYGTVETDVVL